MNWTTVAELGTALGTLVLAVATFASVRSGNRAARLSERSLLEGIRPLILPSRLQDPEEKVGFADDHWMHLPGGHGGADITDDAVYLAIAIRNVGAGLAVLNAWKFYPDRSGLDGDQPKLDGFHRLTRDLYIPPHDTGFWQGTFRDTTEVGFAEAAEVIRSRESFTIDILYGDGEGGQRVVTRFSMIPAKDKKDGWLAVVSRHWNLDREDPRHRGDGAPAERARGRS
jgi:hypothetical protein